MARDERRVDKRLGELKASVRALDLGRKFLGLLDRRSPDEPRIGDIVGSVMTRNVVTCTGSDTLHRAAQLMWDRDCGAIPVVDAHGRAVGLVTDRDLCMAAYTRGRPLSAISVSSLLSARLYTCTATTSLDEAIARMAAQRVRRLVVVEAVRGQRRQLEQRAARVEQRVDAFAGQQLAALDVTRAGAFGAAPRRGGQLAVQLGDQRLVRVPGCVQRWWCRHRPRLGESSVNRD